MPGLLLTGARLVGRRGRWQVALRDGRIERIARDDVGRAAGSGRATPARSRHDAQVVPLAGRLLVPGFHDPHVHVLSAARERAALTLPPRVGGWDAVARLLAQHAATLPAGAWLSVRRFDPATMTGGWLPDRAALDRVCPDRPVRLRHRNLRLDVLNSAALERVGVGAAGEGVERDAAGRPTGRLHQLGPWLREAADARPSAHELRAQVASWSRAQLATGVTSLQDAGEHNGPDQLALLDGLARDGAVRQRLWTMASGMRVLEDAWDPRASLDPHAAARVVHAKLAPVEARLDLDALCAAGLAARRAGLPVAVHATSEGELAAAVAAIEAAGLARGISHRIEHACVASDALVAAVAGCGAAVVANPALVSEAGDAYRAELPPGEHDALHRLASWQAAGVPLAIASDAPVTASPPLAMLDAAMRRRTASGATLGPDEALSFEDALDAATSAGARLVGRPDLGRLTAGCVADLVVLPAAGRASGEVDLTVLGGEVVHVGDALRERAGEVAACGSA